MLIGFVSSTDVWDSRLWRDPIDYYNCDVEIELLEFDKISLNLQVYSILTN